MEHECEINLYYSDYKKNDLHLQAGEIDAKYLTMLIQDLNEKGVGDVYQRCALKSAKVRVVDFKTWLEVMRDKGNCKGFTHINSGDYYMGLYNRCRDSLSRLHTINSITQYDKYVDLLKMVLDDLDSIKELYKGFIDEMYYIQTECMKKGPHGSSGNEVRRSPVYCIPYSYGLNRLTTFALDIKENIEYGVVNRGGMKVEVPPFEYRLLEVQDKYKQVAAEFSSKSGIMIYNLQPDCRDIMYTRVIPKYKHGSPAEQKHSNPAHVMSDMFEVNKARDFVLPEEWAGDEPVGNKIEENYVPRQRIAASIHAQYRLNGTEISVSSVEGLDEIIDNDKVFLINYPFLSKDITPMRSLDTQVSDLTLE